MGDSAIANGAGASGGGGSSHPEPIRTRRGSAIAPPPHWIGQESAVRTAFVTGASSGLGLALVKAFISAGYKVIASCRFPDASEELRKHLVTNGMHPPLQMCLRSKESIVAAYSKTRELTDAIDVFVNNAGVLTFDNSPYDPVMEIGDEEMARVYDVNVCGSLKVMQTFMPLVQASVRHPIVINVSSPLGSLALNRDGILAPYRCSKAALNMLTKTFALEMPSVIFLSVSPRNWDHIPSGLSVKSSKEAVEIKQDSRYSSSGAPKMSSVPGSLSVDESESTEAFDEDAVKIVSLALSAKKEDSASRKCCVEPSPGTVMVNHSSIAVG